MEIRKSVYIILIIFGFFSCKKASVETFSNNRIQISNKNGDSTYKEVKYVSSKLVNGIHIFDFKDKTITLQYGTSTLFGVTEKTRFKVFSSQYDLDLGEINILRYDNTDSQVYIIELKDHTYISYNLYLVENNQVYFLGSEDIDFSKKSTNNTIPEIFISKNEDKISLNIKVDEEDFSSSEFEISSPLQTLKTYTRIEDYIGNPTSNEDSEDENLVTKKENEFFFINIDKDEIVDVHLKQEKIKYVNSNILAGNINCPDTSLDEIILKKEYFTIQKYNCNDQYFLKEYITFKKDHNSVVLQQYSVEQTDKHDPDKVLPDKVYDRTDFGTIQFEDVDEEFLRDLLSK